MEEAYGAFAERSEQRCGLLVSHEVVSVEEVCDEFLNHQRVALAVVRQTLRRRPLVFTRRLLAQLRSQDQFCLQPKMTSRDVTRRS